MSNRDQFGIYVIKDNGAGDSSLRFCYGYTCGHSSVLRITSGLSPSMRPDMELVAIGHYDHSNLEITDDPEVSICLGSDDEIQKMLENDRKFYERVSVDQLPVSEVKEHE